MATVSPPPSASPKPPPHRRVGRVVALVLGFFATVAIIVDTLSLSTSPLPKLVIVAFFIGVLFLVAKTIDVISERSSRPPWRWLLPTLAVLFIAGSIVGYLQLPSIMAVVRPLSRDADINGYCIEVMHVDGFEPLIDKTLPLSPQGQFFCKGSKTPVNMTQACRWKWGPQAKPPSLRDESDAYSWSCHPKYG